MVKINKKSKYLAIIILIGGKSSRFGSDKGLFEFLGKPLISYQLETLSQGNFDIFLVANSKSQVQDYIKEINLKEIMAFIIDEDKINLGKNFQNPIKGLYSAFKELRDLNYKKVLALPCDTPFIQYNVVKYIIEQSKGFDCCIPIWNNKLMEPLLAIYPVNKAFQKSRENLKNRDLKLTNLLDKNWKINYLSIENSIKPLDEKLISFININKPEDIEKLMESYIRK
ncbi:MAG: molybdenum cofactor guanylyltransferase [Promethearchaeota archaeon]